MLFRKEISLLSQGEASVALRKSTIGWKLLELWKNGMEQWIPLSDLKASNPVEVAEFAKSRRIDDEPAFKWWVPYTLKKERQNHCLRELPCSKSYTQIWCRGSNVD